MKHPTFDFPEIKGKTIEELFIFDDPSSGRELLLRFTDNTLLSVALETATAVAAKLYRRKGGAVQLLCSRGELPKAVSRKS